ncbi:MAG TPA: hypothetical protein VLM89_00195 [Phycisphaerae bacterium]|nr:hypothetical protein [Phycisphaerae bacterium]
MPDALSKTHENPAATAAPPRISRAYIVRCVVLLTLISLATHAWSLFDGVVLDDYWHQKGLREHGWSFSELMRTLIIAPGDFLHTWWQTQDVRWHYLRPFFIACMKFVYCVLGRNDPAYLHGLSILLHTAATLMAWWLCWKLTRNRAWSFIGGLMFAIYPHSIVTVAWPSSQNVVIQNTLLLAMILTYIRASRLSVGPETWSLGLRVRSSPPQMARPMLVFTIVLWVLAILTRENAVLMPAVLLAFDFSFGGWRHVWRRKGFYIFCGFVGIAFAAWREWMHIPPLPDVYCRRPDGRLAEYAAWLSAKFLHYFCVAVWPAPLTIGPTGRLNPWTEVPGDCLLMLGIVVGVGLIYFLATRRVPGWWIWPMWIALSILPGVAIVATPHSGYMPGLGFAVGMALAGTTAINRGRLVRRLTFSLIAVLILGQAFMSPVNRLQWIAISSAERFVPEWVRTSPPPHGTRDVFFINIPFINIYLKPNLVSRLGPWFEDINVHVLAWSPNGLMVTQRTAVQQIDDHSFTATIEGRPWFSGVLGRLLLEGFRGKDAFKTGQVIDSKHFRVEILETGPQGVHKMKFTFPRPLNDPFYCFYLSSENCGAARLRFAPYRSEPQAPATGTSPQSPLAASQSPAGHSLTKRAIADSIALADAASLLNAGCASAALPLFEAAASDDPAIARQADNALRPAVAWMADALGSPARPLLDRPWLTPDQWRQLRDWWARHVDDQAMRETWLNRRMFDSLIYRRAEVDWDRWLVHFLFNTDLYMTGPPYADPRDR